MHRLFTERSVSKDASRRYGSNSPNVFEKRSLELFTSEAHPQKAT
jgi:hypothetical protein